MSLANHMAQRDAAVRRSLAVLLLLAFAMLGWHGVILPVRALLTSQHRWRLEVRNALAIARGRAAEVPSLQRHLAALPEAPIWQRLYPDGDSAIAGTDFREDIARAAALAKLTVHAIAPLPSTEQHGLRTLGLRLSAVATIGQLTDFLTQLRRSVRYIRVDALRVVAPQVQTTNRNHRLLVRLQIFGYARLMNKGPNEHVR